MRYAIILAALPLSACATTGSLGQSACGNRAAIEAGLDIALANMMLIENPVMREAAISSINISRAALARCI
jgi:hypothetical protein